LVNYLFLAFLFDPEYWNLKADSFIVSSSLELLPFLSYPLGDWSVCTPFFSHLSSIIGTAKLFVRTPDSSRFFSIRIFFPLFVYGFFQLVVHPSLSIGPIQRLFEGVSFRFFFLVSLMFFFSSSPHAA